MVAVRAQDADRYCASPPDNVRVFLVYGNDPGGITERARQIERVALLRGNGEVVRFGSDDLTADPTRIAEEVYSPRLFGGEPVVALRVLDGRHNVFGAVQTVLKSPPPQAWVVIEAGELKRESPLLKAFEDSAEAAAIPTYHLDGNSLVFLMQSAATEAGVSIDPHAAELLTEQVGNDRLAIRSELDKLFTFVGDAGPVTVEHVAALIGDASTTTPDAILDAALFGDVESLDAGVQRLRVEGGSPASLASQMLRQLILLWTMGVTIESGASVRTAVDRARPPVFSRRRASVEAALRRWSANELIWARRVVGEAVAASRHTPLLEPALVSSALHDIAARSQTLDRR